MLDRLSLIAVSATLLAPLGATQTTNLHAAPIVGAKEAGTFHLATGTWTRGNTGAAAWDDVLFDNTCAMGWYGFVVPDRRSVDDGRIPSTSSPVDTGPLFGDISWTGTLDSYQVNFFEIGYCTYNVLPTLEVSFWTCFTRCQDATTKTPVATFVLPSPGSAGSAAMACWTVGIDLVNSGQEFTLLADCDGMWDDSPANDRFGWSWQQVTPLSGGNPGPYIAGDPYGYLNGGPGSSGCDVGANTAFYTGSSPNSEGTGLGPEDKFEMDRMVPPPPIPLSCSDYGGYLNGSLFASFHMQIRGETVYTVPEPGFQYCPGDGVSPHTPCPCANNNNGAMGGCDWTNYTGFLEGGVLTATGVEDYANPDVTLVATGISNNFGIFFGANNQTNGGNGSIFGDGLRCAGGGLVRLTSPTSATGNTASHGPVEASDISAGPGVTRRYQYWFRTPGGPCGTVFNLTNGYEIAWM